MATAIHITPSYAAASTLLWEQETLTTSLPWQQTYTYNFFHTTDKGRVHREKKKVEIRSALPTSGLWYKRWGRHGYYVLVELGAVTKDNAGFGETLHSPLGESATVQRTEPRPKVELRDLDKFTTGCEEVTPTGNTAWTETWKQWSSFPSHTHGGRWWLPYP